MSLKTQIKEFSDWKGSHSPKAVGPYSLWLKRLDEFVGKNLEDYEITDIVRFSQLIQTKYSPTTHYYMMTIVHTFFAFWNKRTKCMPADLIVTKRVKANSHNAVSEIEYEAILKAFKPDPLGLRNHLMIRLLGECGMRVSELTDLMVTDLNLREGYAVIRTKKTRKERRIVWSEETNKVLIEYLNMREELIPKTMRTNYLFVGCMSDKTPSKKITPRSVQRAMKKACEDIGIERKLSPHGLRHFFAVKRRQNGASIAFVQKALGHSSPITTIDTYEQYGIDEFTDEAKRYFDGKEPKYTPPVRKKIQEEEKSFEQVRQAFSGAT